MRTHAKRGPVARLVTWTSVVGLVAAIAVALPTSSPVAATHATAGPFGRVATVPAYLNSSVDDEAAAEIAAVSEDGRTVIYTDSPGERLGFLDITDPAAPRPAGVLSLPSEPTSVAVLGRYALAAVNTSTSFTEPSGSLLVIEVATRTVVRELDLGGQPDSVAVAPSGRYVAIAVENERNEDRGGGLIPQLPAGWLSIVDVRDWTLSTADLTGLAKVASDDPEPEYVSINGRDEAVVSLQENNHLVVVRLRDGRVINHFPAGTSTVHRVDTKDDGAIVLDDTLTAKREPDGVAWLDDRRFATANEGDYQGGSRGWTIFDSRTGRTVYDSGSELEHIAVAHGLYPDHRSDAKGTEPEGVAVGSFGGRPYMFVNSERGNFVAVYDVSHPRRPRFLQVLPTTNGPEGLLPVPERGLLVVSSEEELPDEGIRSTVQLYQYGHRGQFPSIRSNLRGEPIAWGTLSGLSAVPGRPHELVAVTDSAYAPTRLLTINPAATPALITGELTVTRAGEPAGYDGEGVAARPGGGYWLAVEGAGESPNLLVRLNARGAVVEEVPLPAEIAAAVTSNGLEGVAVVGSGTSEQVWVAIQRELTTDPEGIVRLGRYTVATGEWAWLGYPLDAALPGGWVGLSEVVAVDDDTLAVVERDNRRGPEAQIKRVYAVEVPASIGAGEGLPVATKRLVADLLPLLAADHGWVQDKVEGLAIGGDGKVYAVTDNDAVDDATGETVLLRLGRLPL